MSLVQPIQPIHFDQKWFYPQLLPQSCVILLDGATGVGKSMLCAHLATQFSHHFQEEKRAATLFVSAMEQEISRNRHLAHLKCDTRFVGQGNFLDMFNFSKECGEDFQACFRAYLDTLISEEKPLVLVIDDIEEMIGSLNQHISKDSQGRWWAILGEMAIKHRITIIVTRRNGMNAARHYGTFNRAGTEFCDFILTMHWHPYDPNKRVISIAKNRYGELGNQWHLNLDGGKPQLQFVERHEHVRPSKCPQTWVSDPGMVQEMSLAVEEIREFMHGEGTVTTALKEHMKKKNYSERTVRQATARMGLRLVRQGQQWWYLPTDFMRTEAIHKEVAAARTRAAGVVPQALPETQSPGKSEDSTPCTRDAEVAA
ncbi:MAG: AAA family ATPase [Gemmatales bacterium]